MTNGKGFFICWYCTEQQKYYYPIPNQAWILDGKILKSVSITDEIQWTEINYKLKTKK